MIAQPKLYSLPYTQARTYVAAGLFVIGNILLPQLFHLVPDGGKIWLPIYFFTLVGAYKYGWRVGLLTALLSPLVNSWLFGMPAPAVLPAILLKSVLLAIAAGVVSARSGKVTLLTTLLVVVSYQALGTLGEWIITSSADVALQDARIALPGMLLQIFGATALLRLCVCCRLHAEAASVDDAGCFLIFEVSQVFVDASLHLRLSRLLPDGLSFEVVRERLHPGLILPAAGAQVLIS